MKTFSVGLLIFLFSSVAAFGQGWTVPLTHMYNQLQDEWCWAAVAQTVEEQMGAGAYDQCNVVSYTLDNAASSCCGDNATSSHCNQPYYVDRAMNTFGVWYGTYDYPVAQNDLVTQAYNGLPVPIRIGYPDHGHFVLIYGATQDNYLYIWDPGGKGDKYVLTHQAVEGYSGGQWTTTFYARHR
jgi:hypothetical protein